MTYNIHLENFGEKDLGFAKELYDYYTLHSTLVYFLEPPTPNEIRAMIPIGHPLYRSFTIRGEQGEPLGFCYFNRFKEKAAFRISVEITLYLKPDCMGKGVGKKTLELIEPYIRENGFRNLMALISAENEPSIRLFEKCGYNRCARIENVAEKFGRKLTLEMYQKQL